jgi:pyruvate dehydrogenase E1 component alpha subunit
MYGKLPGCAKGKGGSMHLFDKPHHMYGGHAIVGGQCPLGAGLAFAAQYNGEKKVVATYLGDGALNQGAFHETMNLASIWNLPLMMVLENNMYSMGTHIARGTSMAMDMRAKAESYGMRYAECNGMDVLDVYHTFQREAQHTRGAENPQWQRGAIPQYGREGRTPGPVFVNVKTYRFLGHSMSDPQKYRTKEEVGEYQEGDPIQRLARVLIEGDHATQEQLDDMDREAKQLARAALRFADDAPATPIEELYTDVFAEPYGAFKKGELPEMLREGGEA